METISSRYICCEDYLPAIEKYISLGYTDGLPIILPTDEHVEKFLDVVKLSPTTVLGIIPERNREINVEKVAINAVMAGCLPEYFPVIVTAVQALCDPNFGLHGLTASMAGVSIFLVVNGPLANKLGVNHKKNMLGPGYRANATIGRALRLVLLNLAGKEFDQSTFGHPGKYTLCIAEDETISWPPLHVEKGFLPEESAVTVFAAESINQVFIHLAETPEQILNPLAERMSSPGSLNMVFEQECFVVIGKEHYRIFAEHHWNKNMIKEYLFKKAIKPISYLKEYGMMGGKIEDGDRRKYKAVTPLAKDIYLLAGGGEAGPFSLFISGWYSSKVSRSITKRINIPLICCNET